MSIGRIAGGLALAAVASTTLTTSASAGTEKGDLRDRWRQAAEVQRSVASADAETVTAQGGGCFADPTRDATPSDLARADISQFCAQHDGRTITVSALPVEVAPPDDPAWGGMTGVGWALDTNGDGMPEFDVILLQGEFAVYDSGDNLRCEGTPTVSATSYSGTFPVSCIGGASSFRVQAFLAYDSNPLDMNAEIYEDITAWAGPVVGDTGGVTLRTSRLAGETRYETAVEISQHAFPDSAAIVYVARADAYADALAGGTLTRGPILLVPKCGTVPQVVRDEIRRLAPSEIIALGGDAAVCDDVLAQVSRI